MGSNSEPPPRSLLFSFRQRKHFLVIVLVFNHQPDNFFYGASIVNIFARRCDIEGDVTLKINLYTKHYKKWEH